MEEEKQVYEVKDRFHVGHFDEISKIIDDAPSTSSTGDERLLESSLERYQTILDEYQEQPHLLDTKLDSMLDRLIPLARQTGAVELHAFKLLCHLFKVRGMKVMMRLVPHEVTDMEPVVSKLEAMPDRAVESEKQYVLLLWLAVLAKIPFALVKFDRSKASGDASQPPRKPMSQRIIDVAQVSLHRSDRCQKAASLVLANLLTRPDMSEQLMRELGCLVQPFAELSASRDLPDLTVAKESLYCGNLLVLSGIFKNADRKQFPDNVVSPVVNVLLSCTFLRETPNTLMRKLYAKVCQRIALLHLPRRIAEWRYDRGARSLEDNLNMDPGDVTSGKTAVEAKTGEEVKEGGQEPLASCVETILAQLLELLEDKDTVVRWSAAKGVGRIVNCLAIELADQVVTWVLGRFAPGKSEGSWHGGCLALAELARRGLLLPSRLAEVIPVLVSALEYDEIRGRHSVGDNVRDAGCFVAWAFARAYAPEALRPYVKELATSLVAMSLFDREIICRRAASAAFQEHVGRQGAFPHGIDILTIIDYYNVGLIKNCYGEHCLAIAIYEDYTDVLLQQLVNKKVRHWDAEIRALAGTALGGLSRIAPQKMIDNAVPKLIGYAYSDNLFARHGAVYALGSVLQALSAHFTKFDGDTLTDYVPEDVVRQVVELPAYLVKKGFVKGLGAEMMRKALNHFFENIGQVALPPVPAKDKEGDVARILSILANFVRSPSQKDASWAEGRRDCINAMDSLRKTLTDYHARSDQSVDAAVSHQRDAALPKDQRHSAKDQRDAAANELKKAGHLSTPQYSLILETYSAGLKDYTVDNRGDIGRLVREAAIKGLEGLLLQGAEELWPALTEARCDEIVALMLRQVCDPIGGTRDVAAQALTKLFSNECKPVTQIIPYVHYAELLAKTFQPVDPLEGSWSSAGFAFPRLSVLLNCTNYLYSILLGFVMSAGNLTESLMTCASGALLSHLGEMKDQPDRMEFILRTVNQLYKDNYRNARITTPLMKVTSTILTTGYLEDYVEARGDTMVYEMLELAVKETKVTKFVARRILTLTVCADMVQFTGRVADAALKVLLESLTNQTLRIRRLAAEKLYEALLTYGQLDNHSEHVMSLLDSTDWFADPHELKVVRDEIAGALGVVI